MSINSKINRSISKFNKENPNITIWDTGRKIHKGVLLGYYCSRCEENGFESLYTIYSTALFSKNSNPCLCSSNPRQISSDHVIENTKILLSNLGLQNISVLGAIRKGRKPLWYSVFCCNVHGVYSKPYFNLKASGCSCLACSPPIYGYDKTKKGYLYLLKLKTKTEILGYGITNNFKRRIQQHKRNLKSIGATVTNIQVFEGSGTAVLAVENDIKSLHTTGLLDCEGFRRESISIDRKDEVLEKCKKLKELDNVDKLI